MVLHAHILDLLEQLLWNTVRQPSLLLIIGLHDPHKVLIGVLPQWTIAIVSMHQTAISIQ